MQHPVITEEHHQQYHDFLKQAKGKFPRQKLYNMIQTLSQDDPDFFRFMQGVCGESPVGVYAPYFMFKQAVGGSLPKISDSVKAETLQDHVFSRQGLDRQHLDRLHEKYPPLVKHFLETSLAAVNSPGAEGLEIFFDNSKQFTLTCAMIERQLLGSGPQFRINDAVPDPVLAAMPYITKEHGQQVRALRDRVADEGDTGILLAQIHKNDAALLDFYTTLTGGQCLVTPSAYAGYALAAGGRLPRISDTVKVQVVQDYGPLDSENENKKVQHFLDTIKEKNLDAMLLAGDMIDAAKKIGGRSAGRMAVREFALFYAMLERQIALNKENKK